MEFKAKTVSLVIKIIIVVFLVVCSLLKWLNVLPNCEIKEVCLIGATIGAVFGDVSINTAIDKFTNRGTKDVE